MRLEEASQACTDCSGEEPLDGGRVYGQGTRRMMLLAYATDTPSSRPSQPKSGRGREGSGETAIEPWESPDVTRRTPRTREAGSRPQRSANVPTRARLLHPDHEDTPAPHPNSPQRGGNGRPD
ncbi:unnamed protein product [Pleuronectes platessa]|uniref:Uncharacterized protein n=1 Tax=Pleuronectes platessa TaxID=8262 RepID=A0A9N7TIP5_PLEPL|nr:unnamed protein product [Pleuronectes platessa]